MTTVRVALLSLALTAISVGFTLTTSGCTEMLGDAASRGTTPHESQPERVDPSIRSFRNG